MAEKMRPVDEAMAAVRPEKIYVRRMWGSVISQANSQWTGPEFLYLTLPGGAGSDIQMLVDIGVITLMENGALRPGEESKIFAAEKNLAAYTALRERFPGLAAHNGYIESLAGGDTDMTAFPGKRDKIRNALRARIVNLDYNGPLVLSFDEAGLHYPQLNFIQKLAQLHANPAPIINWTLLLTLNGEVSWESAAHQPIQEYLVENIRLHGAFAEQCNINVGPTMYDKLTTTSEMDFSALSVDEQKLIVSVLVPKKIATLVHNQGWITRTFANWQYGGVRDAAPMCTWAISFRWDSRSSSQPNAVYEESLGSIFESFGPITGDGEPVDAV